MPVIYFARRNDSLLKLGGFNFDKSALFKACTNVSGELMSNISMSLVAMVYNVQLLEYAKEDGVAAYGVLMYVNMIFLAIYIGYSVGTTPIIGYHYGADNKQELKRLLRKSSVITAVASVSMLGLGLALSHPLSHIFVGYDQGLMNLTVRAFYIFSFSFLFAGIAIFGSARFRQLFLSCGRWFSKSHR